MAVTLEEMKNYLRVDYDEDDALIESIIGASERLCMRSGAVGASPYAPTLAELTKLLSVFFTFFNKSVFRQL